VINLKVGDETAGERQAIAALHETDMVASMARDIDTLVSLCSDDCVLLPPGQEPIRGREAVRESLERDAEQGQTYRITEYVHEFEEVRILDGWAFEWGRFRAAAEPVRGGSPIRSSGKILRVLKRQTDGAWKVARSIWNDDPAVDGE
jgi:uncharacterized protein (TIGR02246 family)